MTLRRRTYPPDFPSAAGRNVFGSKITVPGRMPFRDQLRMSRSKAIGLVNFPIRTIGAAPSQRPVADSRLPLMPGLTLPPNLLVAVRGDIFGAKLAILRRVPLPCQIRIQGCQRGLRRGDPAAAEAATPALGPVVDRRRPCVPVGAQPPHLPAAPIRHVVRGEPLVLRWVPLGGELGVGNRQGFFGILHAAKTGSSS